MKQKQKMILIADDDPEIVHALELRCRTLGYDVCVAHSGLAALKMACQQKPDLICLDVEMPGGNGFSACELLAGEETLARVPVVILTGRNDPDTIRKCHNLCAYYVLKCTDIWDRLAPLVRELLGPSAIAAC
jgi:CheY-like chemotaxis protein